MMMVEVSDNTEADSGKNGAGARKGRNAPLRTAGSDGPPASRETATADISNQSGSEQSDGSATPTEVEPAQAAPASDEPETPTLAEALPPVSDDNDTKMTIDQLKDKIMASNNDDMNKAANAATNTVTDAVSDMQNRTKAAYEKSSEAMTELSDFAKGNVEAMVESSKIVASGLQELGRTYSEEARTAYEQMTADMKEMAAVKSPTELFQLQAKIMRRNFDTLVSASSKNNEVMMKLATDAFQPLSGRMNAAADKASKIS
jgi:phasin family protein